MPAEPQEPQTFDPTYVKGLRTEAADWRTKYRDLEAAPVLQKGYLPPEVKLSNTDLQVHIPKFPRGDVDNFSVMRAAYADDQARHGDNGRAWDQIAPWEKAYLKALGEIRYKANMGDSVSGQDGAFIAPEFFSQQWFDVLRSLTAIDQLPVRRFNLPYRLSKFPKITNDVTVFYPGENNTATTTRYQFGQIVATPRKAIAYYRVSNELIRDAGDLADNLFRQSTAGAIALDRDAQIFMGSSTAANGPTPVGFLQLAQSGQVGLYYPGSSTSTPLVTAAATGQPFYQTIAQLINKVEALNSNPNVTAGQAICNGIAANAQFKQTLFSSKNFVDGSSRPLWLTEPSQDGGFMGCKWALTNAIPTSIAIAGQTGSFMVAGWWQQLALFECLTLGYATTQESQAYASDQTEVRLVHRWDWAPLHPEAFVVLAGVSV